MQKTLFPGRLPVLDKDSDEVDENSREFSFLASLFQLGPAEPGNNHFVTDSDMDHDMPPLISVSDNSESDEESKTDSKTDEDGVPGRSIFQLQAPEETAQRDEGQEISISNYLPAGMQKDIFNYATQLTPQKFTSVIGPSPAMAVTQSPLLF